jgi:hypothetical protein
MILNRRRRCVILAKGRAARMTSTRTAQFFLEATLPDELAASPPGWC